jgi:hypothetical protein
VGWTVGAFRVCLGSLATIAACGGSAHQSGGADAGTSDIADGRAETDSESGVAASLDGAACFINTSNYDQSCSVDSDCVTQVDVNPNEIHDYWEVQSGNYCQPMCLCGGGVIGKSAVAQYLADLSKTPLGSGEIPYERCGCMGEPPFCCYSGLCALCVVEAGAPPDTGASSGANDAEGPDGTPNDGTSADASAHSMGPVDAGRP